MTTIDKYPRTQHIEGSRLQEGDHDLSQVTFKELENQHFVVEEKMDGANAGISFSDNADLLLQSRGHFLIGGPRERHWTLFKRWAAAHTEELFDILGSRYVMYGEWMYAKHTVYYDLLPHYFLEFDVYDKDTNNFLSTRQRRMMLTNSCVTSVLVLHEGVISDLNSLKSLVRPSYFKSGMWKMNLTAEALKRKQDPTIISAQTDKHDDMEGLYIKIENQDCVTKRLKWVRHTFLNSIIELETHWLDRTIIPNRLAPGVVIA